MLIILFDSRTFWPSFHFNC